MSTLRCERITVAPGGRVVLADLDLAVRAGELSVLAGPSGAGKTTILRAVAGLEPLRSGRILLGGRDLTAVPTHRRGVALVFQHPRLFPNLDVAENVAFGLRVRGRDRRSGRRKAVEILDEVGLGGFADRAVEGLSGGEQQRVALARALIVRPELLLLDEPLASVDPDRRESLRDLIRRIHRERRITTLYVTHDRSEAAEMGDRVALMLGGRIVQHDTPSALFQRPSSPAVARFFGARNLLRGVVEGGRLEVAGVVVDVPGPDGEAAFTIRPERVRLDGQSSLRMRVEQARYAGTHVRLVLRRGGQILEAHAAPDEAPPVGQQVGVLLPLRHLWRFPDLLPAAVRTR